MSKSNSFFPVLNSNLQNYQPFVSSYNIKSLLFSFVLPFLSDEPVAPSLGDHPGDSSFDELSAIHNKNNEADIMGSRVVGGGKSHDLDIGSPLEFSSPVTTCSSATSVFSQRFMRGHSADSGAGFPTASVSS